MPFHAWIGLLLCGASLRPNRSRLSGWRFYAQGQCARRGRGRRRDQGQRRAGPLFAQAGFPGAGRRQAAADRSHRGTHRRHQLAHGHARTITAQRLHQPARGPTERLGQRAASRQPQHSGTGPSLRPQADRRLSPQHPTGHACSHLHPKHQAAPSSGFYRGQFPAQGRS